MNSILKNAGKWDEISDLDVYALNRKLKEGSWPKNLVKSIQEFQTFDEIERIYLSKINGKEE